MLSELKQQYCIEDNHHISNSGLLDGYEDIEILEGRGILQKAVIFIVRSIVSGAIFEGFKIVFSNISNIQAAILWMNENGLNTSDYNITINRVVYDNGCWQPEFPNNPFCKMIPTK